MKILHIGEYASGGVATYIKTLVKENSNDSVENHILVSQYKSDHEWPLMKEYIHYYQYKRSVIELLKAMVNIRRCIKKIKPDIIYCHSSWSGFMVRLPLLFIGRDFKVIYNAHGWSFLMDICLCKKIMYSIIERCLSRVTDKIINVSKYEYDEAIQYGIPKNKMEIIFSGIIDDVFIEKENNKRDTCVNILFVGRFDKQKGVDVLLNTFINLKRNDIKLQLVGDSVLEDDNIKKNERYPNVEFLGWVSHDEISKYYLNADVVIIPSRWEAFGLVGIEAMKYGKPIIVSNRGALPELVVDKVNGRIFDYDDPNSLADLLEKINKDELLEMGMNALKIFKKKYTAKRMQDETCKIYNTLCKLENC